MVQIFGYKLHTSFDGCNALTRPLQRFCAKPNCMGDEVEILWCSMRFAANAEKHKDIRTKEQKCFKTYGHGLASMCPQEQKGYAVTTMSVINKKAIALNATA